LILHAANLSVTSAFGYYLGELKMRKLLALAFLAVALASGVSAHVYLIQPAHADPPGYNNC
jgi:hypothetical protein